MSRVTEAPATPRIGWRTIALIVGFAIALYAVRVTGPVDLMDNDQLKPAHYVHDVVLNGNWIVQHDTSGDIASKPPLQVWIASVASLPYGRAHWFTLAIPSVIGIAITALVAAWFASRLAPKNSRAPLLAGLLTLCCMMGAKQAALVRTDALFGGTVALTALFAWLASQRKANWVWFWIAGALSTLTKGPLGPLIASFGLLARPWRRSEEKQLPLFAHAIGVTLFFALVGGWVWLAYLDSGQAFFDRVLGKELVGHAVQSGKGDLPGMGLYKSPAYFLYWFAPGAPIALFGLWTMWKDPDEDRRTLVRFLGFWMLGGLLLFSLSPHQRPDLLTPIWAPAGAIAGYVVAGWIASWSVVRERVALVLTIGLSLTAVHVHRHIVVLDDKGIVRAELIDELVEAGSHVPEERIRSFNANSYYEYALGSMRTRMTLEECAAFWFEYPEGYIATSASDTEFLGYIGERGISCELVTEVEHRNFAVKVYGVRSETETLGTQIERVLFDPDLRSSLLKSEGVTGYRGSSTIMRFDPLVQ